ncbi:hypothetical protein B0H17DRAFT_1196580 [Mycena rosella]|uniref:Uncharacterized protein n=1 Tax=Mycena rosella TaxID=1033263 RepID=A0AAD7DSY1_MYCRO|nr:hypothetical protein B0H17DRAFT_1196580 [Mycena rosella]
MFTKPSLIDFLRRLSPTIQKLQIYDFAAPGPEPHIVDEDVLAALIPADAACLSDLQELEITGFPAFSDEALSDFIKSGVTPGALGTLKRLIVRFGREIQVDILLELQHFREMGLCVELTYRPRSIGNFSPWLGLEDDPHIHNPANYY